MPRHTKQRHRIPLVEPGQEITLVLNLPALHALRRWAASLGLSVEEVAATLLHHQIQETARNRAVDTK